MLSNRLIQLNWNNHIIRFPSGVKLFKRNDGWFDLFSFFSAVYFDTLSNLKVPTLNDRGKSSY